MSDEPNEAREGALGWAWLGCSTVTLVVVPLWGVLTAVVLHVGRSWASDGLQVSFGDIRDAAVVSGFWLLIAFALVTACVLLWRGGGRIGALRSARYRRRLDSETADVSRLPSNAWGAVRTRRTGEVIQLPTAPAPHDDAPPTEDGPEPIR